ncbi:hypothetical protein K456DRAFT_924946 [Colletotrichum gloeosporioides 23]|nr:hypothetical protein K456DRAFT_924946 [Colletotrichum gloeosporioides 23]
MHSHGKLQMWLAAMSCVLPAASVQTGCGTMALEVFLFGMNHRWPFVRIGSV